MTKLCVKGICDKVVWKSFVCDKKLCVTKMRVKEMCDKVV